jgi:hypothetical protein
MRNRAAGPSFPRDAKKGPFCFPREIVEYHPNYGPLGKVLKMVFHLFVQSLEY